MIWYGDSSLEPHIRKIKVLINQFRADPTQDYNKIKVCDFEIKNKLEKSSGEIMKLFLKAGLPKGSLQLLLGNGPNIGDRVLEDNRIKGVMFTGSNETAKYIQNKINQRKAWSN